MVRFDAAREDVREAAVEEEDTGDRESGKLERVAATPNREVSR